MKRIVAAFTLGALLALGAGAANAQSVERSGSIPSARDSLRETPLAKGGRSLAAGALTTMPMGWADFCAQPGSASDCEVPALEAVTPKLTKAQWDTVRRINLNVNAAVAPVTDADNYGVEELWTYPTNGKGDCEDYVLLKRRLLIEAGIPRQALLITVVRQANGDGHAVLTLVTDKGDFALDNQRDDIRLWNKTGYAYIKRQSAEDPNVWRDLRVSASQFAAR